MVGDALEPGGREGGQEVVEGDDVRVVAPVIEVGTACESTESVLIGVDRGFGVGEWVGINIDHGRNLLSVFEEEEKNRAHCTHKVCLVSNVLLNKNRLCSKTCGVDILTLKIKKIKQK